MSENTTNPAIEARKAALQKGIASPDTPQSVREDMQRTLDALNAPPPPPPAPKPKRVRPKPKPKAEVPPPPPPPPPEREFTADEKDNLEAEYRRRKARRASRDEE